MRGLRVKWFWENPFTLRHLYIGGLRVKGLTWDHFKKGKSNILKDTTYWGTANYSNN